MGCVSDIVDVGVKRQKGVNRDYDLSYHYTVTLLPCYRSEFVTLPFSIFLLRKHANERCSSFTQSEYLHSSGCRYLFLGEHGSLWSTVSAETVERTGFKTVCYQ